MADASDILNNVLQLGSQFATPFANSLAYGQDDAAELALTQEKIRNAALNGSGPNDPTGAQQAPQSVADFLAGKPNTNNKPSVAASPSPVLIFALLGAGLVAIYLALRR